MSKRASSGVLWTGFCLAGALGVLYGYRRAQRGKFTRLLPGARPLAVVSGASSGIGSAFARILAERGYDLVLAARREDRLNLLAKELGEGYGTAVTVIPVDLSIDRDIDLAARTIQALPRVDVLVNNAGFGAPGPFAQSDIHRHQDMVRLHDIASMTLTRAVLPTMLAQGHGGIINVSSTASFFPLPWNASYSASKAFLNVFTRAVQAEVAGSGVYLQALCPGFTRSEFHDRMDSFEKQLPEIMWMQAGDVARQSLEALGDGEVVFIPGVVNRMIALVGESQLLRPLAVMVARAFLSARRAG